MVLAGLVIALGEVVDDADHRRREHRPPPASEWGTGPTHAPRSRWCSMRRSKCVARVLYGSLIVVLVFVPVFLLEGLTGAFFRPLALAYMLAILASLAVALTMTPALALLLLPKHLDSREVRVVGSLKARYRRLLESFVDRPRSAFATLAVLLVADRRDRAFPWRGVPAPLPRVRLPDALGREARHVARGHAPHHRACEQRADGGAGGA